MRSEYQAVLSLRIPIGARQYVHLSLRCGCPVDTSAKQKHRPSRQARPPQGVWQSVLPLSSLRSRVSGCGNPLPFRGIRILSRFAFRMTSRLAIANTQGAQIYFRLPVIAVRVSGGHLCEAEAPTEPAGETAVRRVAIRFPSPSSLRSRVSGCGNPFSLKGNTDSFARAFRMTSRLVAASVTGCAVTCRSVIAVRVSGGHLCEAKAPTEPAGETQSDCGNPFLF